MTDADVVCVDGVGAVEAVVNNFMCVSTLGSTSRRMKQRWIG